MTEDLLEEMATHATPAQAAEFLRRCADQIEQRALDVHECCWHRLNPRANRDTVREAGKFFVMNVIWEIG